VLVENLPPEADLVDAVLAHVGIGCTAKFFGVIQAGTEKRLLIGLPSKCPQEIIHPINAKRIRDDDRFRTIIPRTMNAETIGRFFTRIEGTRSGYKASLK
jgi:hypothetical protein